MTCLVECTEPTPTDYKWNQYENTEQLISVQDDEIPTKSYNSISGEKLISTDTSIAKGEQSRKLIISDDFKQRSLNNMMDGVLEKRWEDELKKEVQKPPCMVRYMI